MFDGVATHGLLGESSSLVQLAHMCGLRLRGVDASSSTIPDLPAWVDATRWAARGIDEPILFAHSLGTWPTLNAAVECPGARVFLFAPTLRVPGTLELAAAVPGITVIDGSHDLITGPLREGARIASASPGGSRIVLPGVTHSGFLPGFRVAKPVRWMEAGVSALSNGFAPPLPLDVQIGMAAFCLQERLSAA